VALLSVLFSGVRELWEFAKDDKSGRRVHGAINEEYKENFVIYRVL
jgi:hypothetical protein